MADGLILIDKPAGWTSHDAVSYIKRALGVKRAGHTGTLDPDATGLLLVLVGKATRLARYFDGDDKGYEAVMRLGSETDTLDASGRVTRTCPVPKLSGADMEAALRGFVGEISQVPPMYSAVKVEGKPLYVSARAGEEVGREPRLVTVRSIRLVSFDGTDAAFSVDCSKGTYIRTLAADIGIALGSCAHIVSLRRTSVAGYSVDGALRLDDRPYGEAVEAEVVGLDNVLTGLPWARLTDAAAEGLKVGRQPGVEDLLDTGGDAAPGRPVRLMDGGGRLLALAETGDAGAAPRLKVVLV